MLWGWVLLSALLSRAVIWGAARCTHRGEVYDVHDQAHRYALRAVLRVSNTNARPPFAPTCHVSPPVGLAAQCKGLALTHSAQRPAGGGRLLSAAPRRCGGASARAVAGAPYAADGFPPWRSPQRSSNCMRARSMSVATAREAPMSCAASKNACLSLASCWS